MFGKELNPTVEDMVYGIHHMEQFALKSSVVVAFALKDLEKPLIKKTLPTPQSRAKKLPIGRNSATPELL